MSLKVNWSDRLEVLAEKLFESWETEAVGDPFAKIAVVIGDAATRNWLQDYFLFQRQDRKRNILANIDFIPLAQFVNDWLAAQTHKGGRQRRAAEHPYANNVMAWRINAILQRDNDERLAPLFGYIGKDQAIAAKRRFELSSRIAQLFDEYLVSRPEMLAKWEGSEYPSSGAEEIEPDEWQRVLYQKLVEQCPQSYVKDYVAALDPAADLELAFQNGFPKYKAVHLFDISFAPKPFLQFAERISQKLPMTFWSFNPKKGEWNEGCASDKMLMGALASGARGVLDYQREVGAGSISWLGSEKDFDPLRSIDVETHVAHSPRRELEILKNGLHDFFAHCKTAKPKDVLVLCADWATYSPLVEAVFGVPGDPGYIPVALRGGIAEESPIKHAFTGLLDFKDNRFEVNAVVNLLAIPSVRRKFEIDVDQLSMLRDMIQEANIHWGYDDAEGEEKRPFTWRRGLDRLALDALLGERENPDALEDAGLLGRIRPCGHVESERAVAVGHLDAFVRKLWELRGKLNGEYGFEGWRDVLTGLIDDFFQPDKDELDELAGLRRAVVSAARDIRSAWYYAGITDATVSPEVFIAAVLAGVRNTRPHEPVAGDAVSFASLTTGAATPAKLVWVCGLNDGTFPKDGIRAAFDVIGSAPTQFDVTPRDRDLLALLKAAFGARKKLVMSYVGKNVRSNEEVPPSVSLVDLEDWFKDHDADKVKRFSHPLQSYSPKYFLAGTEVKEVMATNFSKPDYEAAENLLKVAKGELEPKEPVGITAFDIIKQSNLELDEIIEFIKRPSTYLKKHRLRVWDEDPSKDLLDDVETMEVKIPSKYKIAISSSPEGTVGSIDCEAMVEMGKAPNAESVQRAFDDLTAKESVDDNGKASVTSFGKIQRRTFDLKDAEEYSCEGNVVEALDEMNKADPERIDAAGTYGDRTINIHGRYRSVNVCGITYSVAYDHYKSKDGETSPEMSEMAIRHIVGHAAGKKFTSVMLRGDGTLRALVPMSQEEAQSRLSTLLSILYDPLPSELPDLNVAWADDKLPQALFLQLTEGLNFVKSVARKAKKA